MRVSILLQITGDDGAVEVAAFEKATERPEDVGLSIAEAKGMLTAVQARTVLVQGSNVVAAAALLLCLRQAPA